MKFKHLSSGIAIYVAIGITLISCSKGGGSGGGSSAPVANFSYTGAGLAPATVVFTNTSTNATSYSWDFGDNATSTLPNPSHTYTQGGVYTVRLTATGSGGSNSVSKTVNIQTPTSVKITGIKLQGISFIDPSCSCGWDPSSGPDIYCTFEDATTTFLTGSTFNDVTAIPPDLSWTVSPAYQITNFNTTYYIRFFDKDINDFPPSGDDFMSGYSFTFSSIAALGYPSTVTLQLTGNPLKVQFALQWQ